MSRGICTLYNVLAACLLLSVISCSEILSLRDPELNHDSYYDAKVDFRVTETVFSGEPDKEGHLDYNEALFYVPNGIAADEEENLFVADTNNHCIRKIDANGITTTYAGSGHSGYLDGERLTAMFRAPKKVDVAADGSVYVIDGRYNEYNIRKISPDGTVYTLYRGGIEPEDIAVDTSGIVYFTDKDNDCIWCIDSSGNRTKVAGSGTAGHIDGPADSARFYNPSGIDIDFEGNILVADTSNARIRKISTEGIVSTVAGSSSGYNDGGAYNARFSGLTGLAVDGLGNIFVTEDSNEMVRKIGVNGEVSTVAGSWRESGYADGQGTDAKFNNPMDLCIIGNGDLFVVDRSNHCIRKINSSGYVSTFAGKKEQGYVDTNEIEALYDTPSGICFDNSGNLIIADSLNGSIRKKDSQGRVSTLVGPRVFEYPYGVDSDDSGNIFVSDTSDNCIYKIDSSMDITVYAGVTGENMAGYTDGPAQSARFRSPTDISLDDEGNLYVADTGNHCIRKIDANGQVSTVAGNGNSGFSDGEKTDALFDGPIGIDVDPYGNIYVADYFNNRIRKIDPSGNVLTVAGQDYNYGAWKDGSIHDAYFDNPTDVLIDNAGNMFISESPSSSRYGILSYPSRNGRIRLIRNNGIVFTLTSGNENPRTMSFDTDGAILITDGIYDCIRKLTIEWE